MAYIGKQPVVGNFQKCDAITVVNGQAAYTMQVGGVNVNPESENHMLVSLNGVLQAPVDSFTISGSTITFASNLSTGDVIDFIMLLGNVLDLGTPSDNTVTAAKIASDAVVTAKINDNAVTSAKMFSTFKNGITQLDQWRLTTNITGDHNPISSNLERADTPTTALIGTGMTESSGIFTFPETGIYEIKATFLFYAAASTDGNCYGFIAATTDNSTYTDRSEIVTFFAANDMGVSAHGSFLFDVTNTSTHKVRFETSLANGSDQIQGNTDRNLTHFTFTRLGDT